MDVFFTFTQKKLILQQMAATLAYNVPTLAQIMSELPHIDPRMVEVSDQDEETGLVMITPVSSNEGARNPQSEIRGTCWAILGNKAVMVVPSAGYLTEIEVTGDVMIKQVEGYFNTQVGDQVIRSASPPSFEMFAEGFVVRMARFRGKDYVMSHRRLNVERSKWGNAHYAFGLKHLPLHADVFGDAESSSECLNFTLTMAHNVTGSRTIYTEKGLDVLLFGVYSNGQNWPRCNELVVSNIDFLDYPSVIDSVIPFHAPVSIPWSKVNDYLTDGNYEHVQNEDPRSWTGEAVILRVDNKYLYKLVPTSFEWRNQMRQSDPSTYHRFNGLMAEPFTDWFGFSRKYLSLTKASYDAVKKHVESGQPLMRLTPETFTDALKAVYEKNRMEYRYLLFLNFLLSLPPFQQKEAVYYYDRYIKERTNLLNFLHAARKHKLFFVDPASLDPKTRIGTISSWTGAMPEGVTKIQKDRGNFLYDVSNVDVPRGMFLTLLPGIHPAGKNIITASEYHVTTNLKISPRDVKRFNAALNKSFHFHLDNKVPGNHYHQLVAQATSWSRWNPFE